MADAVNEKERLAQRGIEMLRSGDAAGARHCLQRAANNDPKNVSVWLALAFANARLGDDTATLDAVDKALALEPRNLRAMLFKGDHLTQMKRSRKALVFYQAALKLAARETALAEDIRIGLKRAQDNCLAFAGEYESFLLTELAGHGYRRGAISARFDQALDIAFGKREVYYQQPTRFYFPGLPQTQFYPREDFPWLQEVEAATARIREEMALVLQERDAFSPYLVSSPDEVQLNDASNVDNPNWGAYYFYQQGRLVEAHAQRCPHTMGALEAAPLPQVPGSTPHALYSRLAAKTRIPPHVGLINTRLICHLPLLVPENCGGLRCGNQVQHWTEGEAYVFDDSIEHEAWNDSDADRVVLLFDIWRPELNEQERNMVAAMLQAVQTYEDSESTA